MSVIDVKITRVSNYRCPITKSSNRTAVIGHPRDRAPITKQIGVRRTNHDREFCYRYDNNNNNNNNNNDNNNDNNNNNNNNNNDNNNKNAGYPFQL